MVKKNQKSKVCAYTRVSSKAGDIQAQRQLVAKATGLSKHEIKSDVALSGNVPVSERKVWQEFAQNRVSKVYVKNAKRFARSVVSQELGLQFTDKHGIEVVALDFPTLLTCRSNKGKLVRQIVAAVNEFDKSEFIDAMSKGRAKHRKKNKASGKYMTLSHKGKCEGRKSLLQVYGKSLVKAVKQILKKPYPKRVSKKGSKVVTWAELAARLKSQKFTTRKMTSPTGTVRKAGRALSKSSLARLLDEMQKRRM